MSWAMLLPILISVFNQRMAAGWPLLKKLLDRLGGQVQADAESAGDAVIGAAPEALKESIIQFLQKQRDKSGVVLKIVYSLLLNALPGLLDGIWDELFTLGRVPAVFATFPAISMSPPASEEAAYAEAYAAVRDEVVQSATQKAVAELDAAIAA